MTRWLVTLLGTGLLAGLVWVFGPLLPPLEPVLPRIIAVQALVVAWALANALLDWRRRAREKALATGLTTGEADAVSQTLARALALAGKGGRASLAELPWYAIIGPPGAGKTTALLNAGLAFTVGEQMGRAAIAGVGGTRLCEWWFTRDAVVIDTAGRYTTQDSNAAVDRAGWEAFLDLLKRTRPRQPLNGLIVAIGLPDVVDASAAERDAHAAAIARRVAELEQRFGLRLPVYVLLTKADLLAGFSEFFDDLDAEGRAQVWGETFALDGALLTPDRCTAMLRGLVTRLNTRLLPRLQAEQRTERRGAILGFSTQVASLERPLGAFLTAAFADTRTLRGVYLTSGTQEGTPIDRLTGAMARAFGIDQARAAALRPERGRSYFLARLLRGVIFNEAMLVREAPRARRRRAALRVAAFAVVLLAALGGAGAMAVSQRTAERQVAAAASALAQYDAAAQAFPLDPVTDGDLRGLAGLLDRAEALRTGAPDQAGLGLDQAGKLQAGAAETYGHALRYGLLPRLLWRLETQMRGDLARPDALYQVTRIYLMLGGLGPLDRQQVVAWMTADWAATWPGDDDAALRTSLLHHLDRLLAEPLPAVALDGPLVAQARAAFDRVTPAQRVYDGLRASAPALALPPWRPSDVLGLTGAQIFARASGKPLTEGIPGLYTAAAFQSVLLPGVASAAAQVGSENWVLGRPAAFGAAELAALNASVTALYLADFTARWDAMLADLNIAPVTSLPQAAQSLYILSSPESPLRTAVRSIGAQLALDGPAGAPAAAHFRPLIDLAGGDGAQLERGLRLLADVQQPLAKIAALPVGTAAPPGGEDISNALAAYAARQPQPLQRWLLAVGNAAKALRTGNARQQLLLAYNAPGGPALACQAAVAGYPFNTGGAAVPLDTFRAVFAPGGVLDGFINLQLKPYLDTSGRTWRPQTAGTSPAPFGAADAAQFQRAASIQAAFFPALHFELAPAATETRAATLTLGDAAVQAGRNANRAVEVTWPPAGAGGATLAMDPQAPLAESGDWAMFRLFARGRLLATSKPDRMALSFPVPGGPPLAFEIRLGGQANPFTPGLLADFRCPALQ